MGRIRTYAPLIAVGLLLALVPDAAFAQTPPVRSILAPACTAGSGIITLILQAFSGFLPVIIGLGVLIGITQRERIGSVVGSAIAHVADMGMTGVLLVASPIIGAMLITAIAGTSCP